MTHRGPSRLTALLGGAHLSRIGLGCAWLFEPDPPAPARVAELVGAAMRAGVRHFDTAAGYGAGEALLGEAVAPFRHEVVLATKAGLHVDPHTGGLHADGRPENLVASCTASLRRLNVDHVDVLYLHRVDPVVPVAESWEAMAGLVTAGKTRGLGICEVSPDVLDRIERIHPVTAVQSELSLWHTTALHAVVPWCARNGAAFVAFAPLGKGYLTRHASSPDDLHATDSRRRDPRFTARGLRDNEFVVRTLEDVARRNGLTPAQTALAWLLALDDHVHAIPGTRQPRYAVQNAAAIRARLPDEDMAVLGRLSRGTPRHQGRPG